MNEVCLQPVAGLGLSRLATRACAESKASCLQDASVEFLWPDDPTVMARMKRLGLSTFGAVAAVPEESLRLHFGKIAPLLHCRAQGIDLTPVRSLYPPPTVQVRRSFDDAIDTQARLGAVLMQMSAIAGRELRLLGVRPRVCRPRSGHGVASAASSRRVPRSGAFRGAVRLLTREHSRVRSPAARRRSPRPVSQPFGVAVLGTGRRRKIHSLLQIHSVLAGLCPRTRSGGKHNCRGAAAPESFCITGGVLAGQEALAGREVMPCASLQEAKARQKVTLAGLIIRPHKPPAAGRCIFFSLEDETALRHVAVVPEVYGKIGPIVFGGGMAVVRGRAERRGEGVSLLAEEVEAFC